MRIRLVDGRAVDVTTHAVERYLERVLAFNGDRARAADHMVQLARREGRAGGRPGWVCDDISPPDWYVLLGPDICLPVFEGRAVTCLARGCVSDLTRAKRKRARQSRKHRARAVRRGLGSRQEAA